jgi:hypothetical protein
MKEKIIAAIKAKFPAINLSKKRLESIAAIIEKKVIDDETKIDATLDSFNEFSPIADIAKQDDALRNAEAKLKAAQTPKDKDDKDDKPKDDKPETPELPDDTPPYIKKLMEGFQTLSTQVQAIQGEKQKGTIRAKVSDMLKDEKGVLKVPESYWGKRVIPEKEEDLQAFVTEVETDYTGFTKELTDKGIAIVPGPKSGAAGAGGGNGKATKEELDAVIKDIM